jgi:hypothetical protein
MEISQGNSLYSYLKQIKISVFKTKLETRRAENVLSGGLVPMGGERRIQEGEYGANTVYACM